MISLSNKIFQSKTQQALSLIDKPLVIFNFDGNNKNYKMFTLIEDHSSLSCFILLPTGESHIIVSSIETALPKKFGDKINIHSYDQNNKFSEILKAIIPYKSEIYVEISENYTTLDILKYSFVQKFKKKYKLISAEKIFWELRSIKTNDEIHLIKKAIFYTKKILNEIDDYIKEGFQENEIMSKILLFVNKYSLEFSFKPIISSGSRASDPHPVRFTKRKLKKNDLLIIDLGVYFNCYTSDLTRTYKIGGNIKEEKFFNINQEMVNKLLSLEITQFAPYKVAEIMDNIAKKYNVYDLQKHGYGHGIGLDVHDISPSISGGNKNGTKFLNNMTFAFEPGFYTPQKSFRIENNYVIKNGRVTEL